MTTDTRSDEELNRIIAEWCKWKFVPEHDVSFITPAGHAMPEGWTDPEGAQQVPRDDGEAEEGAGEGEGEAGCGATVNAGVP